MNLELQNMWSPDLKQPSIDGTPESLSDFNVFVQISIGEVGNPGVEVFGLTVCSASTLGKTESGQFITHTLVLEKFSWSEIEKRIRNLIMHAGSCKDWRSVIKTLDPYIKYSDAE